MWKKRGSTLSVSVFELKIRISQYLICEVIKVEFQRAENPKGIAGNKCALEQVQAADEQFELALRRIYYLLYLSGFRLS